MADNRKHLTTDITNVFVNMRNEGHKLQEIADVLKIPREIVTKAISRYYFRGDVENLPKTGRPRLLSIRYTRSIVRFARTDRKTPFKKILPHSLMKIGHKMCLTFRTVKQCLYRKSYQ